MSPSIPALIRFESFELDTVAGELRKEGALVRLQQQPCKVLALLASRAGELVTREEIRRSVWGEETFVNFDQGLNFCIKEIRAALGDDAEDPRFVETLPRRGYRFIQPVEWGGAGAIGAGSPAPRPGAPPVPSRGGRWGWAAAAAMLGIAILVWALRSDPPRRPLPGGRPMLAVLPFENLSADPAQDSLSEGLTEEVIAQLGRLRPDRVGVIARTSAVHYRPRDKDIDQIGEELGVHYVVEGSVRRGANRVRITVKLIQVSDQTQLWAEAYDRPLRDLLEVQREVAEAVARAIEHQLAPDDGQRDAGAAPLASEPQG